MSDTTPNSSAASPPARGRAISAVVIVLNVLASSAASPPVRGRTPSLFWPLLILGGILVACKIAAWIVAGRFPGPTIGATLVDLLVLCHEDIVFLTAAGLSGQLALLATTRLSRTRAVVRIAILVFYGLVAFWAVLNVGVYAAVRSPLTYPLLCLAGDLRKMWSSIGSYVNVGSVLALIGAPLVYVALALWMTRRPAWRRPVWVRSLYVVGLGLVVAQFAVAKGVYQGPWHWHGDRYAARNPHWAWLRSCWVELRGGAAINLDEPYAAEDLAQFEPLGSRPPTTVPGLDPAKRPKNVIFVVLESVGSQYMGLYGGRFPSTPRLDAESRHSLIFDNIYSHSVWSSSALLAMTISRYPKITWRQSTEDEPQMPGEALGTLLRSRGRRTAFMTPSTLTWARWDLFLSGRGFDRVLTADHLGVPFSTSWGVDDRVVFDRALHWLDEDSDRPFFLMIWTMQGHHPYVPAKDQPVVEYPTAKDPLHNNFLNCLWETDRQLGRLFDGLRRRKLDQNTLVVIVGDHGEAFGEPHAVWSHGMWLYEECIKVPCILWYPPFFQGERRDTVGGHLDLNPTITDLLSLPPESTWQGRSLFDPNRLSRAFVFSANGDYRLGIRDGNWKYIYNANEGGHELFDLASDPDEQTNLADQRADVARQMRRHLSAWVAAGRK